MLDEYEEFQAYTGTVHYSAASKNDATYMGRFTFDTILDFEGLARVLTIVARGYLLSDRGNSITEHGKSDIARARRALCAWCSVPDSKKAAPREAWQYQTDFRDLHGEFPNLVDEQGRGWFCRHVHNIEEFITEHPDKVRKTALSKAEALKKFDAAWRKKVLQLQTPIFSEQTRGAWVLRFDDVLADALELGPLRKNRGELSSVLSEKVNTITAKAVPLEVVSTLISYYIANRQEDTDWVVLPVASFDAFFGGTTFSRKHLNRLPPEIFEREERFGVSRYRVQKDFLP